MSKKIIGVITTPTPIIGEITAAGKSAYELWLDQGNSGTIQDFLNSLDKHYEHEQQTISSEWFIAHNLDKFPSVTVIDYHDRVITGEVIYINKNELKVAFQKRGLPYSLTGKAYLN